MFLSSLVVPLLAQMPAQGAAAANPAEGAIPWMMLVAAIATLVIPYIVGNSIAKSIRMPDYGWKVGLILMAITAGVVIDVAGVYRGSIKRGIDLSGGVKLVYEIDQEKLQEVNVDEIIRRVAEEANKAGDFGKAKPAKVTPTKAGMIEVRLPTTNQEIVKKVESSLAALDLSSLSARLSAPQTSQEGSETVLEFHTTRTSSQQIQMDKLISAVYKRVNPGGQLEVAIRSLGNDQIEVDIPDVSASEIKLIKDKIATAGALEFRIVADQNAPRDADIVEAAKRQIQNQNPSNDVSNGQKIVGRWIDVDPNHVHPDRNWLTRRGKNGEMQVLVVLDGLNITGQYLSDAEMSYGMEGPQVNFQFDSTGATKFGQLTGQNLPQPNGQGRTLGIVLDGQLMSAATIRAQITNSGQITGDFTRDEVDFIVGVLNAGALPAALEKTPVSEEQISAELGRDTIAASETAMIVSGIAVLIFMLIYYRFAGIVADAAVLLNLVLVLAFMILLRAAFTLAGLAGLVLSIGMAVDSNVLIYERMREEKERGAALRMVIRNGFGRAMATIIDMHSTTIITGVVLYLIGTEQLRGFAVTLVLGLLVNLFTAVFCARVVFDIAERKRLLTQLKMLRLFGDTKIDFVSIMVPAISVSILISVLGVFCFWHRSVYGPNMFDTDFTGGTEVHIMLRTNSSMSDAQVRKLVEPETKSLPDATVTAVEGVDVKENTQFIVRTSNQDLTAVKDELVKLFGGKLQTYGLAPYSEFHEIPRPELKAGAGKGAATAPGKTGSTTPVSPPSSSLPPKSSPTNSAPPAGGANKSSAIPRGRVYGLSQLTDLMAVLRPDALLLADTSPPPPASDTKTPQTKAPTAKSNGTADKHSGSAANVAAAEKTPATAAPAKTNPPAATSTSSPATPSSTAPTSTAPIQPPPAERFPAGAEAPPLAESSGVGEVDQFVGGTETTLHFDVPIEYGNVEALIRDAVGKDGKFELSNPNYLPGDKKPFDTWTLRLAMPPAQARPILDKFRDDMVKTPVFLGVSRIGGRVAGDTQQTALAALLASIAMIVIYIWIRFQNVIYGVGAVVALIHDVFITVAALAISSYVAPYLGFALVDPFKISLNVVAAILTICGYSISDTIVIFDRIREVRGKSPDLTREIINLSVNQTLSRTVLTVFTVLLVTLILYISGGQAIHAFAFTMLVGLISGTYSSVYIAAPCLLWMRSRKQQTTTRVQ